MSFLLSCTNQRKQRSEFFFFEGGSNVRFDISSPYTYDASGKLVYSQEQLNMRRKAEILKYSRPTQNNVTKNKYSQLARSSNKQANRLVCNRNINVPTSSSNVPGPVMYLKEDPTIPLYKYISEDQQFQFQDVDFDDFKRLYDLFPVYNIFIPNQGEQPFNTIIILRPQTRELTFSFSLPLCIQLTSNYVSTIRDAEGEVLPKVNNIQMGVYSTRLDIYYSDSLIKTVNGVFRTGSSAGDAKDSDIASSTVTISSDLFGTTDGPLSFSQYIGNLIFPNITLPSVSRYFYTCRVYGILSYGESDPNGIIRSNSEGSNIGNTNQRNVQDVVYNTFVNIDSTANNNYNLATNCQMQFYTNKLDATTLEVDNPIPLIPFSLTTE